MDEFVELENFSELKSNLGKLGKTLGVLALATQFSVKSLLCSPTLYSRVGLRPQSSENGRLSVNSDT